MIVSDQSRNFRLSRWVAVLLACGCFVALQRGWAESLPPATSDTEVLAYSRQFAADDRALSSGARLFGADGGACTSGFPVIENDTGLLAYTTAGHCSNGVKGVARITDAGGRFLGHLLAYRWGPTQSQGLSIQWPQDTDAALIADVFNHGSIRPVPYLYVGAPNSGVRQYIHNYRDPYLGEAVCFGGAVTGESCNGVVTATGVSKVVYDADGVGMNIDGLVEVRTWDGSVIAQPGDSGGPVYIKEVIGLSEVITGLGAIEGGVSEEPASIAYFLPVGKIVPQGWSFVKAKCSWSWFVYSCR